MFLADTWDDYDYSEDWDGGHVFDIRPELSLDINDKNVVSIYLDYENRKAFDGKVRDCWTTGVYWTYKVGTGRAARSGRR